MIRYFGCTTPTHPGAARGVQVARLRLSEFSAVVAATFERRPAGAAMIGGYCPEHGRESKRRDLQLLSQLDQADRRCVSLRGTTGSSVPPLSAIGQVCLKQLPRGNQHFSTLFLVNPQVAPKTLLVE
jgi:hypothetical protein